VQFGTGAADKAVATIKEVIADARMSNDRRALAHAGSNLAAYSLTLEDLAEARSAAQDSLREAQSLGLPLYLICDIEHLAAVGVQTGQVEQAARLIGHCDAWYQAQGIMVLLREDGEHSYDTGGSPCPTHALRKSSGMRLYGSP
jgi:hypothetical protein